MNPMIDQVLKLVRDHQRFLVAAHHNPEGDAIGATVGLGLALAGLGKDVVMYNRDAVPRNLNFLPGVDRLVRSLPDPKQIDVVLIVDCGELSRVGDQAERLRDHPRLVNIDHHKTSDAFGTINLVDSRSSSASELIFRILERGGIPVDRDVATCLFTGIYTDTMMLRTGSANRESFRICGELVDLGVDTTQVAEEYYIKQSEARVRLLARALCTMQLAAGGAVAGISLTARDLEETGAGPDEMEGFIEFPRSIDGVRAAYLLREQGDQIKGSLRCDPDLDVARVAQELGGGGHAQAAGFRTEGTLDEVRARVVTMLTGALSNP